MTYDARENLITLDAVQNCIEEAIDTVGCRNCPHHISLEHQITWRIRNNRLGGWESEMDCDADENQ